MPKSLVFSTDILRVIFWNYPINGICDAASAPYPTLYMSLHTDDPTPDGDQTSHEISYTGYARCPVNRGTTYWGINNGIANPKNPITFPLMTGGFGGIASYWVVGTSHSSSGKILYIGSITPAIYVVVGVSPEFDVTTSVIES